jgi:transposase
MFAIGSTTRIFLASGVTDLRRGHEGLHNLIKHEFGADPLSGWIWVFSNRRRNMVKIFFFDGAAGTMWVFAGRLCEGTFRWPAPGEKTITMSPTELQLLLGGIDLTKTRPRRRWRPPHLLHPAPRGGSGRGR